MSMKSFDKFCEKLITAEPGSEKEIFDERQSVMRMRLAIEALLICVGLIFINGVISEMIIERQWAEYMSVVNLLFAVLCVLWWIIRCAAKGCLVAVSGRTAQDLHRAGDIDRRAERRAIRVQDRQRGLPH